MRQAALGPADSVYRAPGKPPAVGWIRVQGAGALGARGTECWEEEEEDFSSCAFGK